MQDICKWTINTPRSLYNEIRHMSIDEGKSVNQFCQPAIDVFMSELVKLRDQTLATRAKQLEEAQIMNDQLVSQ